MSSTRVFLTIAVLFLGSKLMLAQIPGTGAIAGTVLDPSGAVFANARVTASNADTLMARQATTDATGSFRILLLPPGSYEISVTVPGFKQKASVPLQVVVSETTVAEIKLDLAPVSSSEVQVAAKSDAVQTQSAALGRAIGEQTITALPLANRNYTQILALSSGAVVELPNAGALGKNTQNISVNGAKTTANDFQFNGVDAVNLAENSASGFGSNIGIAIPAPDVISEFKVQTGLYDASYGRSAGANVDLVSRSGSNQLHATLWEFFRNDALNANDFFLKRNDQPRPVLRQNQFGFAIGGPLRKNSTFVFGSYQGTLQKNGVASVSLQTAFLPTLGSDRSAQAIGKIYAGQTGALGGEAIASNGSNINPVALAILNFKFANGQYAIPSPQSVISPGVGQSSFSIPASFREDQFTVNLDQRISSGNELSGRYFYSRAPMQDPFSPFGSTVPGWGLNETDRNHMFVLSDTHTFSPSLVNVARLGFMRFQGFSRGEEPMNAADVGMATPAGLPEIPGMSVLGSFTIGPASGPYTFENTNTYSAQDSIALVRGRHTLRAGAQVVRHQLLVDEPFVKDGFLFFLSFPDFLLGASGAQNGTGLSNIFSSTGASGLFRKDERYTDAAGFIQDDMKVSSRLTVNAGLRYEFFGPPSEIQGKLPNFDPTNAQQQAPAGGTFSGFFLPSNYKGMLPSGFSRSSGTGMWNKDYTDFSPRIGFAWQLLDSPALVLRGGYGFYYERLSGQLAEQVVGAPPFSFTQTLQGAQNSAATLQQPYNPPLPHDSSFPVFIPRTPDSALSVAAIQRSATSPYVQQYSLNVQYEFAHDTVFQLGYVGSKSTHLTGCVEFNQALIASPQNPVNGQTTTTVENLAQRLPYEGLAAGRSYICKTAFGANYNSLQANVNRRFHHGLALEAAYTWSKNLDYTSGTGGLSSLDLDFLSNDSTNPSQARGLNDFDRTHRVVVSAVYAVPSLGVGPRALRSALNKWQFSAISVLQSGSPVTVVDSSAGSVYGNLPGFTRAECTGVSPASSGSLFSRVNGYFNPAAFTSAPSIGDGTGFGNCGVGLLRGPSQLNLDLGIQKSFSITEGTALDFRTEFFNFTNTPKFGQPVNDFATGPAFGLITSTASNPRVIQLALKLQF
ncbi:MAG TPA: TonB-dependent receptor [Candidatus Sulfotelmatobacter sp.]|nr:TonB-dependent receptor [Candidatus Sulfotelmatobacter sp.]